MPLEEYQFYLKLYQNKLDEEADKARQAQAQASMNARTPDGKSIGEVIPREAR
jgi:hypothetical protein